jgi:hydrogenase maturation protease
MDRPIPLLVLGLGNVLCGDDGLGAVAVNRLTRAFDIPKGVFVVDGGTLGLSLLPYIEDARQVILVDAIRDDAPPGALVRIEGDEVAPAVAARLSPHQVGVSDLLEAARWRERYPVRLILWGLVPQTVELGLKRSAAVEAQLPALIDRVVVEAGRLGYPFFPKSSHEMDLARSSCDGARALGL